MAVGDSVSGGFAYAPRLQVLLDGIGHHLTSIRCQGCVVRPFLPHAAPVGALVAAGRAWLRYLARCVVARSINHDAASITMADESRRRTAGWLHDLIRIERSAGFAIALVPLRRRIAIEPCRLGTKVSWSQHDGDATAFIEVSRLATRAIALMEVDRRLRTNAWLDGNRLLKRMDAARAGRATARGSAIAPCGIEMRYAEGAVDCAFAYAMARAAVAAEAQGREWGRDADLPALPVPLGEIAVFSLRATSRADAVAGLLAAVASAPYLPHQAPGREGPPEARGNA